MIRGREGERGAFQSQQQGCVVGVAIVAILTALAIPQLFDALRPRPGRKCLDRLMERAATPTPDNARCPTSDAAYPEGAELACPSPSGHLDSAPRLGRGPDGAWRLSQALPAFAGAELNIGGNAGEARSEAGRASVHLKPGFLPRYILGPVFVLAIGGFCLAMLAGAAGWIRKHGWGEAAWRVLFAAVAGVVGWILLAAAAGSEEWVFERGRVTRARYLFGAKRESTTWTGCLGVVPVSGGSSKTRELRLLRVEDGRLRSEGIGVIPAERLDVAGWMSRAVE